MISMCLVLLAAIFKIFFTRSFRHWIHPLIIVLSRFESNELLILNTANRRYLFCRYIIFFEPILEALTQHNTKSCQGKTCDFLELKPKSFIVLEVNHARLHETGLSETNWFNFLYTANKIAFTSYAQGSNYFSDL